MALEILPGIRLVLASESPRRREILAAAGFTFEVRPASLDEKLRSGESPRDFARRLAREKAEAVPANAGEIVLGADTVVLVDDRVLGKPVDEADAASMLRLLSGREHAVITGICLRSRDHCVIDAATTKVRFRPLSEGEIAAYVASGEPFGKAGGYAIQGLGSKFVEGIVGCYFNVVGLPVALVYRRLCELSRA